ncbi:DUF1990 family protein [Rhodococcus sp. SORGH_AS_0303]|uniref:DUF1990 family protein n=1 Tax=Rhodococcus sp. SORGH_AS_0303 TaxID=3041753 RepID=UPI0027850C43|nr:DUF1990 domain-containing protein [Rhodococcus sp. SORGH_AS_0303]MDQ1201400.1 uncharacterized protein (UPF0548 family) [Rhodococcus sp. SORGH_AS_0303]
MDRVPLLPSADPDSYFSTPLTYAEIGGTAHESMPAGYDHVDVEKRIGTGLELFERAGRRIVEWDMHRGAGLRVRSSAASATVDTVVVLLLGPVRIPCRVVEVIDESHHRGFAYGTLPGHPESGEERFTVRHDPVTDAVTAHIRAFSRPGNRVVALGGPLNRATQRIATGHYIAALTA